MEFRLQPMKSLEAQAIAEWHYPERYTFYDMASDPDDLAEFLDVSNWPFDAYYSVFDETADLIGFFEFTRDGSAIAIGLGMRPDITGRGVGFDFVRSGLLFAANRFKPRQFQLSVATFNARAIKVYERLGFTRTKLFVNETNGGLHEFLQMTMDATSIS